MKVELRDPNKIMKLSRLGSFHQSKLSFLRPFSMFENPLASRNQSGCFGKPGLFFEPSP